MLPDRRAKQEKAQKEEGFFFPFVSVLWCRLEQSLVTCKVFKLFKICINVGFNWIFFSPLNNSLFTVQVFLTTGIVGFGGIWL